MGLIDKTNEEYYLGPDGDWNSYDENYGNYQFISAKDIINNFIISYVGEDKVISKVKRTDVAFHTMRAIQELSYDTLPSTKSLEIELSPKLHIVLPQDYVNYVKFSFVDSQGNERVLYPATKTSDPLPVLQDSNYEYLFDNNGEITYANESETLKRFKGNYYGDKPDDFTDVERLTEMNMGRRYGGSPENMQSNGTFFIDQVKGLVHFSANLVGKIITIKYISDGLAYDEDTVVHKFAEEAVYKYVAYAVLASKPRTPEYVLNRYKKEKVAARRNAKIRLSNIKIEEIAQTMRNKSKQIKH